MQRQIDSANAFAALHVKGAPVVIFNVWDAGSAKVVAKANARAIATGSWAVAAAHGYADGEALPLELVLANLARIVGAVDVPVSVDLEGCYGVAPEIVAETVTRALTAGAIGINFEDQIVGGEGLHAVTVQAQRISAARAAAQALGIPAFINARTDIFLKSSAHQPAQVEAAVERAHSYAAAGASGFFAPGLVDEQLIETLCEKSPLPVNFMMGATSPSPKRLAELGASRLSYGGDSYQVAMRALGDAARAAHAAV